MLTAWDHSVNLDDLCSTPTVSTRSTTLAVSTSLQVAVDFVSRTVGGHSASRSAVVTASGPIMIHSSDATSWQVIIFRA